MYNTLGEERVDLRFNPIRYVILQQGLVQTHLYLYLLITAHHNNVVVQDVYCIQVGSITLRKGINYRYTSCFLFYFF